MKKTLLLLIISLSINGFAQTILFSETFETSNSFTLNSTDLGGGSTFNSWVINNSYTGGSGTLTCLGFPFSFTVSNTPAQPMSITGSPSSSYMHISAEAAISSGINCASYIPSDGGTCISDETNFTKLTTPISTLGLSGIFFDFWWICAGSINSYGEVYYSLDGGTTWIVKQSNMFNNTNWTQSNITDPIWDNQPSLQFAFRFVNNTAATAADPAFSIDEITISNNCQSTSSTISEIFCDSYTSPSGSTYSSTGIYTDTIPNTTGCDSIITIDLIINNSTTSSITETGLDIYTAPSGATYTSTGIYTDIIPNIAGCDSTITIDLTMNFTSLDEAIFNEIIIYPNPGSSYVSISISEDLIGNSLHLFDETGRTVLETYVYDIKTIINTTALERGLYYIKIGDSRPEKFIKIN